MKKIAVSFVIMILFAGPQAAFAQNQKPASAPHRIGVAMLRGSGNLFGLPCEIVSTIVREPRTHPWVWPVTWLPRLVSNLIVRPVSAINDMIFYPWVAPFTESVSPWTDIAGLPRYPWQID